VDILGIQNDIKALSDRVQNLEQTLVGDVINRLLPALEAVGDRLIDKIDDVVAKREGEALSQVAPALKELTATLASIHEVLAGLNGAGVKATFTLGEPVTRATMNG